ncbi:MAG: hypothetical protein V4675_01150 [Verrucomicrobiota bacterium]
MQLNPAAMGLGDLADDKQAEPQSFEVGAASVGGGALQGFENTLGAFRLNGCPGVSDFDTNFAVLSRSGEGDGLPGRSIGDGIGKQVFGGLRLAFRRAVS